MRRYSFALILLLIPLDLVAYKLQSQRFVPDKYYLGEKVRVVLEVDYPELVGDFAETQITNQLPSNLDYHIDEVYIAPGAGPNSYIIEISYALYNNDINRLAAFSADGFFIEAITIPRALSSRSTNLNGMTKQSPSLESTLLSLPWVDLSIALLIQFLVLLPIILLQSSKKLRNLLHKWHKRYLQRKPYRQFLRQLHLILQKETQPFPEYYRILSSQMRYYLGHRTSYPCSAYTTEELSRLNFGTVLPPKLWENVLEIMQSSDNLRFGKNTDRPIDQVINQAQKHREVQTLIEFAKTIEKLFHSKEGKLQNV